MTAAMGNFGDERHALYVGSVIGLGMKHGLPMRPEIDAAGNYTDRLILSFPDEEPVYLVVPPPPDEWEFR